jgi:hypothetical protein
MIKDFIEQFANVRLEFESLCTNIRVLTSTSSALFNLIIIERKDAENGASTTSLTRHTCYGCSYEFQAQTPNKLVVSEYQQGKQCFRQLFVVNDGVSRLIHDMSLCLTTKNQRDVTWGQFKNPVQIDEWFQKSFPLKKFPRKRKVPNGKTKKK